jgi:hypothetical protein
MRDVADRYTDEELALIVRFLDELGEAVDPR